VSNERGSNELGCSKQCERGSNDLGCSKQCGREIGNEQVKRASLMVMTSLGWSKGVRGGGAQLEGSLI